MEALSNVLSGLKSHQVELSIRSDPTGRKTGKEKAKDPQRK